jgi:uncharacterized MAPEG superfamily protein
MNLVYLVLVLVLFQYIYFLAAVGKARATYGIKAPATSGNEHFERYYRVQMNTLELLICFIPGLLISAQFWSPVIMAMIGLIFFIGRYIYFKTYIAGPEKRTMGFVLSTTPIFIFLFAIIVGILLKH